MSTPHTILERITARKHQEVAARKIQCPTHQLESQLITASPARGFAKALAQYQPGVIAEIKKASPSRGIIREEFDPAQIAQQYEQAGAACLSVLTDIDFFSGNDAHLIEARQACSLPVIRKDFVIDPYQIIESRVLGADCILLIVACLNDAQLRDYYALATQLSMDVLIEVHDRSELERALALPAPLIGINNRNLKTFEVSLNTAIQLRTHIPTDKLVICESGIASLAHVALMQSHHIHHFLVGEAMMRSPNPGDALTELFGQITIRTA